MNHNPFSYFIVIGYFLGLAALSAVLSGVVAPLLILGARRVGKVRLGFGEAYQMTFSLHALALLVLGNIGTYALAHIWLPRSDPLLGLSLAFVFSYLLAARSCAQKLKFEGKRTGFRKGLAIASIAYSPLLVAAGLFGYAFFWEASLHADHLKTFKESEVLKEAVAEVASKAASADNLAVSADGLVVTDNRTRLVWQRDGSGMRTGCSGCGKELWRGRFSLCGGMTDADTCTWTEAKAYCAAVTIGGVSGWRLPTLTELQSLLYPAPGPKIDQAAFPNTPADGFWTSSPYDDLSGDAWSSYVHLFRGDPFPAWGVYFGKGDSGGYLVSGYHRVRCVR